MLPLPAPSAFFTASRCDAKKSLRFRLFIPVLFASSLSGLILSAALAEWAQNLCVPSRELQGRRDQAAAAAAAVVVVVVAAAFVVVVVAAAAGVVVTPAAAAAVVLVVVVAVVVAAAVLLVGRPTPTSSRSTRQSATSSARSSWLRANVTHKFACRKVTQTTDCVRNEYFMLDVSERCLCSARQKRPPK